MSVGMASIRDLLSIIVPCYNEEEVIVETMSRLSSLAVSLDDLDVELIFIDDGSTDSTRSMIKEFKFNGVSVRLVGFSRNFGHQIAVTAGIDAARGDAVVLIDADLQDPPEMITEMVAKWREGFDVVYGTRTMRAGESFFKLMTAHQFYRLIRALSDVPIPLDAGDFRLMSRAVASVIRAMPENDRFVRGMVTWAGFRQFALPYERQERFAGVSKYPVVKMLRFAADGILSFSIKPLRLASVLGIVCAAAAAGGIVYAMLLRIFTDVWVEGWTALMIAVLFLGGVQLVCVGLLGEYVGRIYMQSKARPLYVCDEYFGFEKAGPEISRSPGVVRQVS